MLETLKLDTLIGARDGALLLVDFAGAFRRSELVSLDVAGVSFTADGLVIQLRRSKTDQEASVAKSVCRSVPTYLPAPCARCASGWSARTSGAGRCSVRLTATETSNPNG